MKTGTDSENKPSELRRRAEYDLAEKAGDASDIAAMSPEGLQNLIHELQVHQIELEMQNEELLQGQLKLEELNYRYLDLYDFAPVGYVTLNDKGLILEANLTAVRLLGEQRPTLMERTFSSFVCPEFGDAFYFHLQKVFESQSKQTCEIELVRKEGTQFWAQLESIAIQDESGHFKRCRTVVLDITDRKKAEEAREEMAKALEKSNQDLEQFAFVAAHDLREPLIGVAACLKVLERLNRSGFDSESEKYLTRAIESSLRMDALIQSLLAYSLAGNNDTLLEPTDCNEVLDHVLLNLGSVIEESDTRVTSDKLPKVTANWSQLVQLFQNLISNAIKFAGYSPPEIRIGVEANEEEYRFFVIDNGIGIEPPYFDNVFRIFQRLETGKGRPGTGIGLANCKKVVERHGGRIWVESRPGQGSTFFFTLPMGLQPGKE